MLIRKGEIGTPGKIRTYDLLLRRQEHLRYAVDATGAIERLRGSKRACSALFDAPFDAPIFVSSGVTSLLRGLLSDVRTGILVRSHQLSWS
jgi:hypothetical protein